MLLLLGLELFPELLLNVRQLLFEGLARRAQIHFCPLSSQIQSRLCLGNAGWGEVVIF